MGKPGPKRQYNSEESAQRHREIMAQRSREQSRGSREIRWKNQFFPGYPDEPTVNKERRDSCGPTLKLFCETYLPLIFNKPWSDDHLVQLHQTEESILYGGLFAEAAPRGDGKTARTIAAAIWGVLYRHIRVPIICSAVSADGKQNLEDIKILLTTNEFLMQDFPHVCYPLACLHGSGRGAIGQLFDGQPTRITWAQRVLTFPMMPEWARYGAPDASGSAFISSGLFGATRGKKFILSTGEVLRPDFSFFDDPQTRESSANPLQTAKRLKTMHGDVLKMAGPGKKMAAVATLTVINRGDLADQILDKQKYPQWHGFTAKMLYEFPTDKKLWDEYAQLRRSSFRAGGKGETATAFYRENQAAMDAGAVVGWKHRFADDELSAVQAAMNFFIDDPDSFWAEYQNEPIQEELADEKLAIEDITGKTNGRPRGEIPNEASVVVGGIDIGDDLLWWQVWSFWRGFNGALVDYGVWPDQGRAQFSKAHPAVTLGQMYQRAGAKGAVQAGLLDLVTKLRSREFISPNGAVHKIKPLMIDTRYDMEIVANVIRKIGEPCLATAGEGIGASRKPMAEYNEEPGGKLWPHCYYGAKPNKYGIRYVRTDVNWFKSFAVERFKTAPGDPGSLSIFGNDGRAHEQLANSIANSEFGVATIHEGSGRRVVEWRARPGGADNDWFDNFVQCMAAAHMAGIKLEPPPGATPKRKPRQPIVDPDRGSSGMGAYEILMG